MVKKVMGVALLIGAAVAGTWYYAAQRFEEQAQVIITNLASYKPYVTYSQATIDKYRFQIHLTNLSVGTGPNGIATPEGTQEVPPLRFDMNLQTTMFYNPFTKVLSICESDATKGTNSYIIHHGNKTTTLKPIIEGKPPVLKIGFTEHPILAHIDWIKFLQTIRQVDYTSGKIKLENSANNKDVLSVDQINYNLVMDIPREENSSKEYSTHFKGLYKNYIMTDETIAIIKDIASTFNHEPTSQDDLNHFLDLYVGVYLNNPTSDDINLKVTMPKDELATLIAHLKEGSIPSPDFAQVATVIPSVQLDLETNSRSVFGQAKSSYNINYKKLTNEGRFAVHIEASLSDKLRSFLAKAISFSLKDIKNPESNQPFPLSEQEIVDMIPDLANISPVKFDFLLDMSAKDGPEVRDFHLNMSTKDYQTEVKGQFNAPEMSASLEFKNYKHFMTDFMAYLDRLTQKVKSIEFMPNTIAGLKFVVMLADRIINQLGSYSPDETTLTIKGSYNLSTGQSFVNGKPLEEVMGLVQQHIQETILPDQNSTGEQGQQTAPSQTVPIQPDAPSLPNEQKDQTIIPSPPQPSLPQTQGEGIEPNLEEKTDDHQNLSSQPITPDEHLPTQTPGQVN